MNFETFLQERAQSGNFDSEGQFTVDLSKASDKVAAFALPSENHYLLKVIQVGHRLRAEQIRVQIGRFSTNLVFELTEHPDFDMDLLYRAVADPLGTHDALLRDLVAALYGTLNERHTETSWSWERDGAGDRLVIGQDRRVVCERFEGGSHRTRFLFSVTHADPWKFWKGAGLRAEAASIILQNCTYSAAKIFIDGQEQSVEGASIVNSHVLMSAVDMAFDQREPASNILFELASDDEASLSVLRPSLSAYLVRKSVMNVWASGMRARNTLTPDGMSSAAWMLQFRRDDENISMRWARKRDRYKVVLGLNVKNPGSDRLLQLKIIRSGVITLEKEMPPSDELEVFRGCALIFADETLETDLTGFQYLENDDFRERILSYAPLVEAARAYYKVGKEMMNIPEQENLSL